MDELIARFTALPNLHPAIVHYPLALVPLALGFDVAALVRRASAWLDRSAATLYALAGLAGFVTYRTGRMAEDSLGVLSPAAQNEMAAHADHAWETLWVLLPVAALRVALCLWGSRRGRPAPLAASLLVLAGGLASFALLFETADHGGALVYEHGVAVQATRPAAAGEKVLPPVETPGGVSGAKTAAATAAPPESRLRRGADGALFWEPLASDREALGTILQAATGSTFDGVEWAGDQPGPGLPLRVRSETVLYLQSVFGDVQVAARLDLSRFDGRVGLVHHADPPDAYGLFELATDGGATLLDLRGGKRRILGEGRIDHRPGTVEMVVSVAGEHLKGVIDDKTIAHGHLAPGEPGRVGLRLDGRGDVRILNLRAEPIPAGVHP